MSSFKSKWLGKTFQTPKGGTLKVVGVNGLTCGDKRYICECSICSKDTELFPYGSISTRSSSFLRGSLVCGCDDKHVYTEEQNKIRVKRKCDQRGYTFNGWVGDYIGVKTKLKLHNPATENSWDTTTITALLYGHGDPVAGMQSTQEANLIDADKHIAGFLKAGFTSDYKFWRSDRISNRGYKDYWYYTCPHCSNDEYVKAGVCSGVFESMLGSLRKGIKSCRCSNVYSWTKEQREYQVGKICKEENLTLLGLKDKSNGKTGKGRQFVVDWICTEGHQCTTNVGNFLTGTRCPTCKRINNRLSGNGNGYYYKRSDEQDYLYVFNFDDRYIKVGRSFNVKERMMHKPTGLSYCSGLAPSQIKPVQIFTGDHQTVYDTEQWIHGELRSQGFEYNEEDGTWSMELFSLNSLPTVHKLLKQIKLIPCDPDKLL